MRWPVESLAALSNIVERKFDDFQSKLMDENRGEISRSQILGHWKQYLKLHGIDRAPATFSRRGSGEAYVWMECPWSVQNSTRISNMPGDVYTKSNLFFPMDLAEKIVILQVMP